ncbi:pfkB family carbohydrate kinase domain-containing protein [Ditylenchus destructor]|nr:pfkB family carbohydrate kinase domain-containing protein [Ditylenchus destructor]
MGGTSLNSTKKPILIVGLCCMDIVNFVDKYPEEDSDTRVFEQRACLGGNAANSITVLHQLEENCELFASLPKNNSILTTLIHNAGFNIERCLQRDDCEVPVSTVIANRKNGSRTILHYRGSMPELSCEEFIAAYGDRLNDYGWIHFEGRNFDEVAKMMTYVLSHRKNEYPKISVELEKVRPYPYFEQLVPQPNVVFMSKDFARAQGWNSMTEAVHSFQSKYSTASITVICPWGEQGVAGRESLTSSLIIQQAFTPEIVMDTLGAGDCFLGACLYYLNGGHNLQTVLEKASQIAGKKCGMKGLTNLDLNSFVVH